MHVFLLTGFASPELSNMQILNAIARGNPTDFEQLVCDLLGKMGLSVEHTGGTDDKGIDVRARTEGPLGVMYVVQCKRYRDKPIDSAAVRELNGVVQKEGANKGILISTSSFTAKAMEWAKGLPIALIPGEELVKLIRSNMPEAIESLSRSTEDLLACESVHVIPIVGQELLTMICAACEVISRSLGNYAPQNSPGRSVASESPTQPIGSLGQKTGELQSSDSRGRASIKEWMTTRLVPAMAELLNTRDCINSFLAETALHQTWPRERNNIVEQLTDLCDIRNELNRTIVREDPHLGLLAAQAFNRLLRDIDNTLKQTRVTCAKDESVDRVEFKLTLKRIVIPVDLFDEIDARLRSLPNTDDCRTQLQDLISNRPPEGA